MTPATTRRAAAAPYDQDAEERVVSAVVVGGREYLEELRSVGVHAGAFYLDRHRAVWTAAENLAASGEPIDSITLGAELRRIGRVEADAATVATLALGAGPITNASAHAGIVLDQARRREALAVGHKIRETTENGFDPATVISLADELRDVVRDAKHGADLKLTRLDVAGLLAVPPPPVKWIVDAYVPSGTSTLLHGDGGLGKTLLAHLIARCVAGGVSVLGRETDQGRVVIIDGENHESEIARRLHALDFAKVEQHVTYHRSSAAWLGDPDAESVLTRLAKPAQLVILDSLRAVWAGDEREAVEVREVFGMLNRVAETTDTAILVLHHDRKTGGYSGSSDLNNAPGARLHLTRNEKDAARLDLVHGKARSGPYQPPLTYSMTPVDGTFAFRIHAGPTVVSDTASTAAAWITEERRTVTTQEIADRFNVDPRTVRRWVENGDLRRLGIESRDARHTALTSLQTIPDDPDMTLCPDIADVHQEPPNHARNPQNGPDMDIRGHTPMSTPQTRMVEPNTTPDIADTPYGGEDTATSVSTPQKPQFAPHRRDAQKQFGLDEAGGAA